MQRSQPDPKTRTPAAANGRGKSHPLNQPRQNTSIPAELQSRKSIPFNVISQRIANVAETACSNSSFALLQDVFAELCEREAYLWANHQIELPDAVDDLQAIAERTGLIAAIGQDRVQHLMSEPFAWAADAKRPKPAQPAKPQYRTPQSTIDAFMYVVRLNDQPRLLRWLREHPKDADYLEKLLEEKCQTKRS
jgi:hypothetical protein